MKNYAAIALVACVAFVTLTVTTSHAQVLMKVDVPFSFRAGHGTLPAGQYSITRAGIGQSILLSSGRRGVEIMTPASTEGQKVETAKLVFHRYGNEYFLAEVWTNTDDSVRNLAVSQRERQMAKAAGASPEFAVVYGMLASASGK